MTLRYTFLRKPGNILELIDKIKRKGLENKVTFNVLTQDKLNCAWPFYWAHKDSIKTDYYAVISSIEDPRIYLKKYLGTILWGIQLPWAPRDERILEEVKENYQRIKQGISSLDLRIVQEYVPSCILS